MNDFNYIEGELHCEEVPLAKIAREVGTPFYCYSYKTMIRHYKTFDNAFDWVDHIVSFAVKANASLAVLRALSNLGAGADIVSGGELSRALGAGMDPKRIVYSGVGKTIEEIDRALSKGILMFNVESSEELTMISARAKTLGVEAPISLRINPDIDPKTHPYISTGLRENKFGFDIEQAPERYREARKLPNVRIIGVDCHIGSQITEVQPFIDTIDRLALLVDTLRSEGDEIRYFDIGGGLGITYNDEEPPHPEAYATALRDKVLSLGATLVLEPGRVIMGNAGALITNVLYRKRQSGKFFIVVDAGMNDLIRPSLYKAHHDTLPVKQDDRGSVTADIVGPICESGDFIARDRTIQWPEQGDLIAVMSAGAYGFTMASNYNSRPRGAEVMVFGDSFHVIRKRETYDDLVKGESIPDFMK
jgi:diaminopimelate decarboxylase